MSNVKKEEDLPTMGDLLAMATRASIEASMMMGLNREQFVETMVEAWNIIQEQQKDESK